MTKHRSPVRRLGVLLLLFALLATACGGKKLSDEGEGEGGNNENGKSGLENEGLNADAGESGLDDAGDPKRGGKLVYGLEADTNGGFCLPEGQLAISGMMVVRAIYDTLTVPNSEGEYVPYLAESVTPNDDYTQWDIKVREGVKFHDGTDLTGEVVKNNIDAYRGAYEPRKPLLFVFVLQDVESTELVDDMTVRVKVKRPWVAFPSALYAGSRMGIVGQSQLDDTETCDRKLVGTGPFEFKSWKPNQSLTGTANPDYWQKAPDGKPYPYAESIEFRPIPESQVRNSSIKSGDINIMHTSDAESIGGTLREERDAGNLNMYVSEDQGEVSFVQLNSSIPPFDDIRMRKAMAMGADRDEINELVNDGLPTVANGPFAPGSMGYIEDTGFPKFDKAAATALVKEYKAEGKDPSFSLRATSDPSVVQIAELVQERAKGIGVNVRIVQSDQAQLINDAIGGKFQAMTFRNYPGGDPDTQYNWWYGGSPVNFGKFDDKQINELLDKGRESPDEATRKKAYEDLNRRFGEQVWSIWSWWTPWAIVESGNVHGVLGPDLPDGSKPATGLATGHSLLGLWIDQ